MWNVEGVCLRTQADYEAALSDKKIIDMLKSNYNLEDPKDIETVYSKLQNVHFKTKVGDQFDDFVFDLHDKVKKGLISAPTVNNSSKKADKNKKKVYSPKTSGIEELDAATKKKVLNEIKKQNRIRAVMITILLIGAFASIGYFIKYYSDAARVDANSNLLNELKDKKFADILHVTPVVKRDYDDTVVIPDILDEYVALYNKNKSFIGWVKIEDTVIDYPVMQTNDNEYYLRRNFNGESDKNGCIFLDCNCDVILGNTNYILYGHHMKSGKMFASLINYADKEFYEKHKIINFDTIYEKGTYEVMYAFRSHIYNSDEIAFKYYQFIDAHSSEEFDSYMEEMAALSLIDTGVTARYGDRLLTLSTCDYQETNGRFVVVAKRID